MVDTINIGKLKWHHITNPTIEDLDFLRDNFRFHPLDIDDCSSFVQRPKIDIYDDYYFLVLHFPIIDKRNSLVKTEETKIFWGQDYLITVGNSHYVVQDLFKLTKIAPEEDEDDEIQKLKDGRYILDPLMTLSDLEYELDISLDPPTNVHVETLSGLIQATLGVIPAAGSEVTIQGYKFRVLKVEGTRMTKVMMILPSPNKK